MTEFRRIGAGFCGTVWTSTSEQSVHFGYAFKREDGGPGRSLLNDSRMHQDILKAHNVTAVEVSVPYFGRFINSEDEWWTANLRYFPSGYTPCNTIMAERIPAIPQDARELLIDKYCPEKLAEEIKCSVTNQDCLIRPYLGRRRHNTRPSRFAAFSLRNYPLHLDQMEELGLSSYLSRYAEIMAETLAMMHWAAAIDANDVEFVLAPPREKGCSSVISNCLGNHVMWILDFDCCRKMSFDDDGIDQAVTAFFKNDPFFPRPGQDLWESFRRRYILTSIRILQDQFDGSSPGLPLKFVQRVEEWSRTESARLPPSWCATDPEDEKKYFVTVGQLPDIRRTETPSSPVSSSGNTATGGQQDQRQRLLSQESTITTTSSFAERQQAAIGANASFREIGRSSVGKTFEKTGTIWAYKILLLNRTDKLWNNYLMPKQL
ncbi:predicted protein [Uncinocarpus reesii 1704]|uniref:DUF3669 domain-containing protein n=1 Tax=Uncinocarpus reesii (strain UAMH 1704) TaxID=336963 RepID=C4JKH2_UNCRE|nr:uncharacterized protein UREG_02129 [Uncinocarpus reesii 1704]EEP77280.1 predicted protein [Uncinocarpus reesii 1704]